MRAITSRRRRGRGRRTSANRERGGCPICRRSCVRSLRARHAPSTRTRRALGDVGRDEERRAAPAATDSREKRPVTGAVLHVRPARIWQTCRSDCMLLLMDAEQAAITLGISIERYPRGQRRVDLPELPILRARAQCCVDAVRRVVEQVHAIGDVHHHGRVRHRVVFPAPLGPAITRSAGFTGALWPRRATRPRAPSRSPRAAS